MQLYNENEGDDDDKNDDDQSQYSPDGLRPLLVQFCSLS
jgi:hypothetical protein